MQQFIQGLLVIYILAKISADWLKIVDAKVKYSNFFNSRAKNSGRSGPI